MGDLLMRLAFCFVQTGILQDQANPAAEILQEMELPLIRFLITSSKDTEHPDTLPLHHQRKGGMKSNGLTAQRLPGCKLTS